MKNPYWKYKRLPTVAECDAAITETREHLGFWEQMKAIIEKMQPRQDQSTLPFEPDQQAVGA